jgi:hypothetical protein
MLMAVPLEREQSKQRRRRSWTLACPPPPRVVRWDEVALAFTTLLFATTLHPIGYVIAINGVLCHGGYAVGFRYGDTIRNWDVFCNCVIAVYVNLCPCGQPWTGITCAIGTTVWLVNMFVPLGFNAHSAVHAAGVHLPMLVGLCYFASACDETWPQAHLR